MHQQITELTFLRQSDTVSKGDKMGIDQLRYYIVTSSLNENDRDSLIKHFVNDFKINNKDGAIKFNLIFYKESDITNLNHLENNKRDIDRYSQENDLIWDYTIDNEGKLVGMVKYRSGQIVYPEQQQIIIKDR